MARGNDERHNSKRKPQSYSDMYYPTFYPRLRTALSNVYNISDDDAMRIIDAHRNQVALGDAGYEGYDSSEFPLINKIGTYDPTEALDDAVRSRHMGKGSLDTTRDYATSEPALRHGGATL